MTSAPPSDPKTPTVNVSPPAVGDSPGPTSQMALTVFITTLVSTGGFATAALSTPPGSTRLVLSSLALAAYLVALLAVVAPGAHQFGLPSFRLGSWLLFYSVFAYGIASLSLLRPQTGSQAIVNPASAPAALATVALGFTAFVVGYKAGPWKIGRQLVKSLLTLGRAQAPAKFRSSTALILVYLLGVTAVAGQIVVEGSYGYLGGTELSGGSSASALTQPLNILTHLKTVALFGLASRVVMKGLRSDRSLLGAVLASEILLGLLSGLKEEFVTVIVAVAIPFILRSRRLPLIKLTAVVVVFVFVVTPFISTFRDAVRVDGERLDVASSLEAGVQSLTSGNFLSDPNHSPSDPAEATASRVRLVDSMIVIRDKTPQLYPFRDPSELLTAPLTGVIPRAVWPSKPIRLTGLEFYKVYYGGQGYSASALTMQGSLYLYGGAIVVVIGLLLIGVILRAIDENIVRLGPEKGGLLALILFNVIVKQELDAASFFASLPIYFAMFYVSVYAVLRNGTRGASEARVKSRRMGIL